MTKRWKYMPQMATTARRKTTTLIFGALRWDDKQLYAFSRFNHVNARLTSHTHNELATENLFFLHFRHIFSTRHQYYSCCLPVNVIRFFSRFFRKIISQRYLRLARNETRNIVADDMAWCRENIQTVVENFGSFSLLPQRHYLPICPHNETPKFFLLLRMFAMFPII